MSRIAIVFSIFLIFAFYGCKNTPDISLQEVQKASCDADYKGFLKRVNADKLKLYYLKQMKGQVKIENEMDANKIFKEYMQILKDDIQRGEESKFCKMKLLTKESLGDSVLFTLAAPNNTKVSMRFIKFANQWLLAELNE